MRAMRALFETGHEVTQFCLKHQGKCFPNWRKEEIFSYICAKILDQTLFLVKDNDKVTAIAIAKPTGQGRLIFYEVIGNRAACKEIFRRVMERWPDLSKFFAFRYCGQKHDLEELNINAVKRFACV